MINSNKRKLSNLNSESEIINLTKKISFDLLGPVVLRWLLALNQYISYFDDGYTAFLYCARAGVRIRKLYECFLKGRGAGGVNPEMFWISRLLIAKGVYSCPAARERAVALISREYESQPLSELVSGLLRHQPERLRGVDLSTEPLKAHGFNFPGWLTTTDPAAVVVRSYLTECGTAFETYLNRTLNGRARAVLIDSGWQGSAQSLLRHGFPDVDWKGIYFGRILMGGHDPLIVHDVIGLLFERDVLDTSVPESAFIRHRHIIEGILEPNGPSIEEIFAEPFSTTAQAMIDRCLGEEVLPEIDSLYLEVLRYVEIHAGDTQSSIVAAHQRAMPELARIIVTPTREEALALKIKGRSADFGKVLVVPVLNVEDSGKSDHREDRIRAALWQEGQVALEFDRGIARNMQLQISGCADIDSYFDPRNEVADKTAVAPLPDLAHPKVAIITRTKNRPLLLERALASVANQTFDDYVWVVVNDGGDEESVRAIMNSGNVDRRRMLLVSNAKSQGMEAASNAGINACRSEFVVIHDDDDSWSPNFLAKTVSFLESAPGARYGGVITHTLYVSEEIRDNTVIEHYRKPYQDWVRNVQIAEMACNNFFPPIAFVFRRSIWEEVGGFNEYLPVLGDWFFNLEFLLKADIGVIVEPLAYYHHRDGRDPHSGLYVNSVIGGIAMHEKFAAVARNEFLRRHGQETSAAMSVICGYSMNIFRDKMKVMLQPEHESVVFSVGTFKQMDLFWTVAQANRILLEQSKMAFWRKQRAFKPEDGLEAVVSGLRHLKIAVPPPDDFDEKAYLAQNWDVAGAVERGEFASGYMHYLSCGMREGRARPSKSRS